MSSSSLCRCGSISPNRILILIRDMGSWLEWMAPLYILTFLECIETEHLMKWEMIKGEKNYRLCEGDKFWILDKLGNREWEGRRRRRRREGLCFMSLVLLLSRRSWTRVCASNREWEGRREWGGQMRDVHRVNQLNKMGRGRSARSKTRWLKDVYRVEMCTEQLWMCK